MPALAYRDFDRLLDRDSDGYGARVLASPAGQSTTAVRFAHPFAPLELENFLLRVGGRKRGIRGAAVDDMRATIADFGGRLFDAVFAGEVAGLLAASRGATSGPDLWNVIAISGGTEHSLALHRNGRVSAWGSVGGYLPSAAFVAIAAGHRHSLAIVAD